MFFRGSLDKLGIYPDIYQIGKYKSAGDMFTQKQMTDAHREYINSLLDDLYGRYINTIAQARRKSPGRSAHADRQRAVQRAAGEGRRTDRRSDVPRSGR